MALSAGSAITESLELYTDKLGDPTSAIYARFYATHPEAEELFGGDTLIPRRMMAGILGILIDLADGTLDPAHSAAWVVDHIAYEVTRPMIETMFSVIVDAVRTGLAEQWTPQMEADWIGVLDAWASVVHKQLDA